MVRVGKIALTRLRTHSLNHLCRVIVIATVCNTCTAADSCWSTFSAYVRARIRAGHTRVRGTHMFPMGARASNCERFAVCSKRGRGGRATLNLTIAFMNFVTTTLERFRGVLTDHVHTATLESTARCAPFPPNSSQYLIRFFRFSVLQEVLHTISSPHGQVHRIVIFKKNGVQAMVEYPLQMTQRQRH